MPLTIYGGYMNTDNIAQLLDFIYGTQGREILPAVTGILEQFRKANDFSGVDAPRISNRDAFLICYGDMLSAKEKTGETGLSRLHRFMKQYNANDFSWLHLLPFHPYSSDDGFSVIDYSQVDTKQGTWDDIAALGKDFKLTFDFVINHGSVQSEWFTQFLAGEDACKNRYVTRPADYDSSKVVRPRTHPLLTAFTKKDGSPVHVWTTFSADQVDYDFSDPGTLLEFIRVFLDYCRRGGQMLRLDAIAYLWKEDGTPCLHHPKTHAMVRLLRAIGDCLGLPLLLLTETNVPHKENLSYFGGAFSLEAGCPDFDESHLVYNFALPPLVLHAAVSGNAEPLRKWAQGLPALPGGKCFLNFLASHDGVGLTPAKGLVDEADFAQTLETAKGRGALVSMKSTPQGPIPYELNCNWADMVAPASMGTPEVQARAFLATYAAALSLPGLPAVYFHSWIGSRAWKEGPALLSANRAINREKPAIETVESEIREPGSFRSLVMNGFHVLFDFRKAYECFSPECPCSVLAASGGIFALQRDAPDGGVKVVAIENFSSAQGTVDIPPLGSVSVNAHGIRWIAFDQNGILHELLL